MNYHWFLLIAACRLAVVQREYKLWHIWSLIYYFLCERRLTGRLFLQGHDIFLSACLSAAAAAGKKTTVRRTDRHFHQSLQVQRRLMWFTAHNHDDGTAEVTSCQSGWSRATMKEYFNQVCCVLFPSNDNKTKEQKVTKELEEKERRANYWGWTWKTLGFI